MYTCTCRTGKPKEVTQVKTIDKSVVTCEESNKKLLSKLKECKHSKELYVQTCADAELGRMTTPKRVDKCDLTGVRLCPRFGVEQGSRPDGSLKIRCDSTRPPF